MHDRAAALMILSTTRRRLLPRRALSHAELYMHDRAAALMIPSTTRRRLGLRAHMQDGKKRLPHSSVLVRLATAADVENDRIQVRDKALPAVWFKGLVESEQRERHESLGFPWATRAFFFFSKT